MGVQTSFERISEDVRYGTSVGIFTFVNAELLRAHIDRDFETYARIYTAGHWGEAPCPSGSGLYRHINPSY
jgi:hypothetical protein